MAKDTGTVDTKEPQVEQVKIEPTKNEAPVKDSKPAEQVAEFAGATGVDGPAVKKKPAADQPEFQANATDAAEEEAAKKKKIDLSPEELASLPQEPAQPKDDKPKKDSPEINLSPDTPIPGISAENMGKINEHWGIAHITPELNETLQNASIKQNKETKGLSFTLANDHTIQWVPDYGGLQGFVGVVGRKKLDDLDAKMIVATLASQGNTKINLHGDRESKEKMWLEAMRQGLTVTNFQPLPSDDPNSAYQKWQREFPDSISGASQQQDVKNENAPDAPATDTPDEKPAEEAVKQDAPKEETPAEVAAEEKKPVEAKAEDVKVEDKKPEEPKAEDKKPEEVKAEAPAEAKPSIAESSFAKKPEGDTPKAKEEAKVETPAAEKPAEDKPTAKDAAKSSFIGDKTDKKDEAPAPAPPPTPKSETLEETLDRRIKQAKNPEVEAALKTLRAEYKSGTLKLDDIDKEIVQKKLGGTGALSINKVNQAIGHVATKPENKGIVLPEVSEQKPQTQKPRNPTQKMG